MLLQAVTDRDLPTVKTIVMFLVIFAVVVNAILEQQTTEVDAASGATSSSDGIMKAVKNALQP